MNLLSVIIHLEELKSHKYFFIEYTLKTSNMSWLQGVLIGTLIALVHGQYNFESGVPRNREQSKFNFFSFNYLQTDTRIKKTLK